MSGEMDNCFGSGFLNRPLGAFRIAQFTLDEGSALIHCAAMAFGQVIKNRYPMTRIQQLLHAHRPDVASPSRDKNIHGEKTYLDTSDETTGKNWGNMLPGRRTAASRFSLVKCDESLQASLNGMRINLGQLIDVDVHA